MPLEKSRKPQQYHAVMKSLDAVFAIASSRLPAAGVDCLLIGGFAVNYYGYSRNTLDVDFMFPGDQLDQVKQIMVEEGFTNISIHDNVVFFNKPGNPLRIDFLRADARTMQSLLSHSITIRMHGCDLKVPGLKDLIAMKIFALTQSTDRRLAKDLPDISYLTVINNLDLEKDIHPICNRFGSEQIYELIRKQVEILKTP